MARNRMNGGRVGAVRGRTQFRLPNGHYAKVDRATGRILSVKADRTPYKGIVITAPPVRLPRRAGERRVLPALVARGGYLPRRTIAPPVMLHPETTPAALPIAA